jgi:hypothetical protein
MIPAVSHKTRFVQNRLSETRRFVSYSYAEETEFILYAGHCYSQEWVQGETSGMGALGLHKTERYSINFIENFTSIKLRNVLLVTTSKRYNKEGTVITQICYYLEGPPQFELPANSTPVNPTLFMPIVSAPKDNDR